MQFILVWGNIYFVILSDTSYEVLTYTYRYIYHTPRLFAVFHPTDNSTPDDTAIILLPQYPAVSHKHTRACGRFCFSPFLPMFFPLDVLRFAPIRAADRYYDTVYIYKSKT